MTTIDNMCEMARRCTTMEKAMYAATGRIGHSDGGYGERAQGAILFTQNPTASSYISVRGALLTFVVSGAVQNQCNIGVTLQDTMNNMVIALAAGDATISAQSYAVQGQRLIVYAPYRWGTAGNGISLSAGTVAGCTVSASTLQGGTDGWVGTAASTLLYLKNFTELDPAQGGANFIIGANSSQMVDIRRATGTSYAATGLTGATAAIYGAMATPYIAMPPTLAPLRNTTPVVLRNKTGVHSANALPLITDSLVTTIDITDNTTDIIDQAVPQVLGAGILVDGTPRAAGAKVTFTIVGGVLTGLAITVS